MIDRRQWFNLMICEKVNQSIFFSANPLQLYATAGARGGTPGEMAAPPVAVCISAAFVAMVGGSPKPNRKISELDDGTYQLQYGGQTGIVSVGSKAEMKALVTMLDKIYAVPEGAQAINDIISTDNALTITLNTRGKINTSGSGLTFAFDMNDPGLYNVPSFAQLGHELQHARVIRFGDQLPLGNRDPYRNAGTTPPWERRPMSLEIELQKHYGLKPARLEYYEAINLPEFIAP